MMAFLNFATPAPGVAGPTSSTNNSLALFSGTSGQTIKNQTSFTISSAVLSLASGAQISFPSSTASTLTLSFPAVSPETSLGIFADTSGFLNIAANGVGFVNFGMEVISSTNTFVTYFLGRIFAANGAGQLGGVDSSGGMQSFQYGFFKTTVRIGDQYGSAQPANTGFYPLIITNFNTTDSAICLTTTSLGNTLGSGMFIQVNGADNNGHIFHGNGNQITLGNSSTDKILYNTGYYLNPRDSNFGNSGTSTAINWFISNNQRITLNNNTTLTFSNPTTGGTFRLIFLQDGTGGHTVAWPANIKWSGGTAPTVTATANTYTFVELYYDGTNYYGLTTLNLS